MIKPCRYIAVSLLLLISLSGATAEETGSADDREGVSVSLTTTDEAAQRLSWLAIWNTKPLGLVLWLSLTVAAVTLSGILLIRARRMDPLLQSVFDSFAGGIIVYDANGNIQIANPVASEFFDLGTTAGAGRKLRDAGWTFCAPVRTIRASMIERWSS